MSNGASPPLQLLLVDDDDELRAVVAARFRRLGMRVTEARSGEEALARTAQARFDVALLDLHLPGISGIDLLAALKERLPETEAILLTAHSSIETAVQAMKRGAYDYVAKPCRFAELEVLVQKAHEKSRLARREGQWVKQARHEQPRYRLVGDSPAMKRVVQMIERVAPADATVLVRGAGVPVLLHRSWNGS